MKIAITSDSHVSQMGPQAQLNFNAMIKSVTDPENKIDVFCVAGDIGEGELMPDLKGQADVLLGSHPNTLFVLGNHDLYKKAKHKKCPDSSMKDSLSKFNKGIPLEIAWDDESTVIDFGDTSFIGTIGFPDFNHPLLTLPRKCYENKTNYQTIDPQYISLKNWCKWTDSINASFKKRLDKAINGGNKNIVIISHYPCFQTHSYCNPHDFVWPYFYNYQLGVMILDAAQKNMDKKIWSIAGHSHEYCLGIWRMEWENLYTLGIKTTYSQNEVYFFDTDKDPVASAF